MKKIIYLIGIISMLVGISILFAKNKSSLKKTNEDSFVIKKREYINNKNFILELEEPNVATGVGANSPQEYFSIRSIYQEPKIKLRRYKLDMSIGLPAPSFLDEFKEKNNEEIITIISGNSKIRKIKKKVVYWAEYFLKHKVRYAYISGHKKNIYRDCTYFVRAVYWKATGKKIDLLKASIATGAGNYRMKSGVQFLHAYFKKKKRFTRKKPQVGDVIFFDNTYDRNRNRRRDDWLTHVGVITKKRQDGTYLFVHGNASRRIKRGYLNLKYRSTYRRNGKILNSYMRRRYRWEGRRAKVMTGDLARGFGGF